MKNACSVSRLAKALGSMWDSGFLVGRLQELEDMSYT